MRSEKTGATLEVGIDAVTGRVVNFHHVGPPLFRSDPGKEAISREEALASAKNFIKMVNPAYAGNVVLEKDTPERYGAQDIHSFRFFRVVNGIPFPMDGIDVSISADGQVVDYWCKWHRVTFPRVEGVISPKEAAQKWLENASYRLNYFFPRSSEGHSEGFAADKEIS